MWLVRRKKPESTSPNRTIALPASPTPRIWQKSQIPCPHNGLQSACANSASVGFIARVSVLLWIWRSRSGAPFNTNIRSTSWSTGATCCSAPGRQMDEIFQALIDRTRGPLNLDRVRTIFGDKKRPHYDKRKKNPTRWGVVVETPTYDVTIFKVQLRQDDLENLYQRRTRAPHRGHT